MMGSIQQQNSKMSIGGVAAIQGSINGNTGADEMVNIMNDLIQEEGIM